MFPAPNLPKAKPGRKSHVPHTACSRDSEVTKPPQQKGGVLARDRRPVSRYVKKKGDHTGLRVVVPPPPRFFGLPFWAKTKSGKKREDTKYGEKRKQTKKNGLSTETRASQTAAGPPIKSTTLQAVDSGTWISSSRTALSRQCTGAPTPDSKYPLFYGIMSTLY